MKRKLYQLTIILTFIINTYIFAADYSSLIEANLEKAGNNKSELKQALSKVPSDHSEAMQFLIAYMPTRDLKTLSADFLLENVEYSYKAVEESPWKDKISKDMLFNDVMAYYCINERRDNFRKDFYTRFKPLIAEAKTPGEAAVMLNQKIFKMLDVIFSRKRPKADQSPYETIEAHMASCTGMSILLIEACRSVGIPARFAGTPLWTNKSGNHSWVEVWDDGWHYTGGGEPSGDALDEAWFTERAKTAQKGHPLHAIYATSYKHTDIIFPLPWLDDNDYIHVVDVTDRYLEKDNSGSYTEAHPNFDIEASLHALNQLKAYLQAPHDKRKPFSEQLFISVPLSKEHADKAKELLWNDYAEYIRKNRKDEMDAGKITIGDKTMPFFYSVTGEAPEGGRSLYISLHGGGGTTQEINDQQWENQKKLYQIPEGVYLAPRAPNNAWNMWFQDHIDAMFDRIIQDMIVFENVNPDRVYLMGYSAGGDGLFRMAPRMADRWAAASMMAGHPGDTSMISLFNTAFSIHMGENDTAYNRNKEAVKYGEIMDTLERTNPGWYPHWTEIYEGKSHWIDKGAADAIPWMHNFTRKAYPKKIIWQQNKHKRFFWLAVDELSQDKIVRAKIKEQTINIDAEDIGEISIRLNDDMADLNYEITIKSGDKQLYKGPANRTIQTIRKTLAERVDPGSIFSSEIKVKL